MPKPKKIRRGNEPIPALVAWMERARRPVVGIFGPSRDFPLTTKELATLRNRQRLLFPMYGDNRRDPLVEYPNP